MRQNILCRFLRIAQILQCHDFPTLESLAQKLEVSQRTVKRDLETLRIQYDAPIQYCKIKRGYYLGEPWTFCMPDLTESEVISLLLVTSTLKQFHGTPLQKTLHSIEKKLDVLFCDKISLPSHEVPLLLSINPNPIQVKKDVYHTFEQILKALSTKKQIEIEYYTMSTRTNSTRIIDPYHIYHENGIWYFCGYCHTRQEIRDFAMDRVQSSRILSKSYRIPADFNPTQYCQNCFRMIKGKNEPIQIWFDEQKAPYIQERKWHSTQHTQLNPDGSLLLTLVANPDEIKRWVLGFGIHAILQKPVWLQQEIQQDIQEMKKNYS